MCSRRGRWQKPSSELRISSRPPVKSKQLQLPGNRIQPSFLIRANHERSCRPGLYLRMPGIPDDYRQKALILGKALQFRKLPFAFHLKDYLFLPLMPPFLRFSRVPNCGFYVPFHGCVRGLRGYLALAHLKVCPYHDSLLQHYDSDPDPKPVDLSHRSLVFHFPSAFTYNSQIILCFPPYIFERFFALNRDPVLPEIFQDVEYIVMQESLCIGMVCENSLPHINNPRHSPKPDDVEFAQIHMHQFGVVHSPHILQYQVERFLGLFHFPILKHFSRHPVFPQEFHNYYVVIVLDWLWGAHARLLA